jgi:SNF2 family DNA or RNA helicase
MIRNTRSIAQLHLPARVAFTIRVSPRDPEGAFHQRINEFVITHAARSLPALSKMALRRLMEAAGSSHLAASRMLERIAAKSSDGVGEPAGEILDLGKGIRMSAKAQRVVELLKASRDQKIVFVNYLATVEHLRRVFQEQDIPHVVFQGGMSPAQKQAAVGAFREGCPVLLATGIGGEGHNLQFCHVMVNYDLPWNPMQIEQRIGRIHRIGQEKEVQVYNFCLAGSLEDQILEILDRKINMFELVVGEIDMILGRLQDEKEFSDMVYEIWVRNPEGAQRQKAFDALASRLKRARKAYEQSKELDEKLFREDFGV